MCARRCHRYNDSDTVVQFVGRFSSRIVWRTRVMDAALAQHAANVLSIVRSTTATAGRMATGNMDMTHTAIATSWRRCMVDYSLDPARHYAPTVLDARTLKERQAEHADLVRIASAEIDWLYEYIAE